MSSLDNDIRRRKQTANAERLFAELGYFKLLAAYSDVRAAVVAPAADRNALFTVEVDINSAGHVYLYVTIRHGAAGTDRVSLRAHRVHPERTRAVQPQRRA